MLVTIIDKEKPEIAALLSAARTAVTQAPCPQGACVTPAQNVDVSLLCLFRLNQSSKMLKSTICSKRYCTSFSKIVSFHCCDISKDFSRWALLWFVVITWPLGVYLYDDLVMWSLKLYVDLVLVSACIEFAKCKRFLPRQGYKLPYRHCYFAFRFTSLMRASSPWNCF